MGVIGKVNKSKKNFSDFGALCYRSYLKAVRPIGVLTIFHNIFKACYIGIFGFGPIKKSVLFYICLNNNIGLHINL